MSDLVVKYIDSEVINAIDQLAAKNTRINELLEEVKSEMANIDNIFAGKRKEKLVSEYKSKLESKFNTVIEDNKKYIEYLKEVVDKNLTADSKLRKLNE